jgi:hypothetical protein
VKDRLRTVPLGDPRRRDRGILLLCLATVAVATLLRGSPPAALDRILGGLDPLLVAVATCALGLPALRLSRDRGWIGRAASEPRIYLFVALLGALLTLPAIVLDLLGAFPEEMNIPLPPGLLAYPAIALVAEFAFHVIPLGLLAVLWPRDGRGGPLALALAALPEPILQVAWGAGHSPAWANALVGLHLLVFNLIGLLLLRRHGFLSAYVLRLGYYGVWHLAWGEARLGLLFGE